MSIYSHAIGWANTSKTDMVDAMLNTFDQNLAARDLGMWNWQWNARARQLNLASEQALISSRLQAQLTSRGGPIYSALNQMIRSAVPKTQELRFAKALNYAETDDKISGIIETQVDFGMSGFRVASKDAKAEKKIEEWNKLHRIPNSLLEMWHTAATTDNVVVMMQTVTKALTVLPLPNLKIVPTHVSDKNGIKQFRTFLKLPDEMRVYIKKILQAKGKDAAKALKGIPKKWIVAAQHPHTRPAGDPIFPMGGYVELGEPKSKEKIFIMNRKGIEDRLVEPSMLTVFASIALRQLLQDGEVSIAYLIRFFIHQIKVGVKSEGKSLAAALRAGTTDKKQRDEVKDRYRIKIDKAFFEVTDQNLEHIFHFPGADVDMLPRYATPDQRIEWWARISKQIVVGDKGSYSGGLIYLKGYSAKISRFRELFSQFLQDIYREVLEDKDAEVEWNEHFMKEPRQVLREIELLVKRGMDMETAVRALGYSWSQWVSDREKTLPPDILAMKGDPKKADEYWRAIETPFFEVGAGMLTDEQGGRPSDGGEQIDDSGAEPNPRTGNDGADG